LTNHLKWRLAQGVFSAIGTHPFMIRTLSIRLALAAALLGFTGCRRETIRVYVAPKEAAAEASSPSGKEAQIAWKLPETWRETEPSKVCFASFIIPDTNGDATVNISQLPDLKGRESLIVNMWREQVGQSPLTDEEAAKALTPRTVAGAPGQSFEVSGSRDGKPTRIVTVMLHRPEASWFFKLSGNEPAVLAHKAEFLAFASAIRFIEGDGPPPATTANATEEPAEPQFKWAVPEGWTTLQPGQMQVAKFAVPEKDGAKAEVFVSVFPSDTGGTLANVNRWRKQLGLDEVDEAGLKACVQPLDATPGAILVELINEKRQLIGAMIPRDGRWWFYKMMGDAPAVAAAKDGFIRFVQTAP
jgi:hypothetical protein